jgi:hypothetical protein
MVAISTNKLNVIVDILTDKLDTRVVISAEKILIAN